MKLKSSVSLNFLSQKIAKGNFWENSRYNDDTVGLRIDAAVRIYYDLTIFKREFFLEMLAGNVDAFSS
jgi:hypothetical protein